jgi:hypothetical protein
MPEEDPKIIFNNPNMTAREVYQAAGDQYIDHSSGTSSAELTKAFADMMALVEKRPEEAQRVLKPMVEDVQAKATQIEKGDTSEATQSALESRLRGLLALAPDVAEVFMATFANPVAGIALTFKKIADRAKATASGAG